ncbi:MurR/RpiR family transcriptional regulator [Amphibiibacter pelophylacis]|uniref:MurR/RpiR family transcriptional regulator n=1 Tax=Amphibiibacter pelophylacis TaxID=1799477 RepID=A0ACC6P104_9BURK
MSDSPLLDSPAPPASVDELVQRIAQDYDGLSRQLKVIARYIEQHRDHVGLDGIQTVAQQCEVQPSAVVRFAKHFGFSGFSAMQAVLRAGLTQQIAPSRSYQARIRGLIDEGSTRLSAPDIAREFLGGSVAGMQALQQQLDEAAFAQAVDLLADSDALWIVASRRSFPVAVYLDYALQHTDKRVGLFSALGSMHEGQVRSVRTGDVLVAVSFAPYAEETLAVVDQAVERGARVIALTDSRMCPLARRAEVVLAVQDNVTLGFRALTSTMGLAQSLFIALAYRLELPYRSTTRTPGGSDAPGA